MQAMIQIFIYSVLFYVGTYHLIYGTFNLLDTKHNVVGAMKVAIFNYLVVFSLPLSIFLNDSKFYQLSFSLAVLAMTIFSHPFSSIVHRSVAESFSHTGYVIKRSWLASSLLQKSTILVSFISPIILSILLYFLNGATATVILFVAPILFILPLISLIAVVMNERRLDERPFHF